MHENRYKFTTYLAGPIEHVSKENMKTWRQEITEKLNSEDLLIYDPVVQESIKVGKPSGQQIEYVKGLKKCGKYDLFFDEMWKIWYGHISQNTDIIQLLTNLRMRKHIDGNYFQNIKYWGDSEAVVRSDFIIVRLSKDEKTVGTIYEIVFAYLFRIPIYLILPDCSKTDANSSLIFGIQISGGEIFYSINDCVKYITEKYKIKIKENKE